MHDSVCGQCARRPIVALAATLSLAGLAAGQVVSTERGPAWSHAASAAERWTASALVAGREPATVLDPSGDTFGGDVERIDVVRFEVMMAPGAIVLDVELSEPIDPPSADSLRAIDGFFEIDVDQDEVTGAGSLARLLSGAPLSIGAERIADLLSYDPTDGATDLLDATTGEPVGRVPVTIGERTVTVEVPLELLAPSADADPTSVNPADVGLDDSPVNDSTAEDGLVNAAVLVGTLAAPTDVAPNVGFVPSDDTALLLGGGRFRIGVEWSDFSGGSGRGRVVPLQGSDSGLFYFFQPANWEMLVKVLDGCAINQHFWVFFAATTNVEFRLEVVDSRNGLERQYVNPLGQPADAVTDTEAFATCP